MDKNELRRIIKARRLDLFKSGNIDIISQKIINNILNSDIFKKSMHIALYYPLEGEVDLRPLLDIDKEYYLPKCIINELFFAKYDGTLVKGCFNISEPQGDIINPDILDLIYIPCLCANNKCYRLGYGKGFYDKFLKKHSSNAKKIIVCPDCFINNDFIEDIFDYKCDGIISETL